MRRPGLAAALSRRAPTIIILTLVAALAAFWSDSPTWLPYTLAALVAAAAIVVMATRERRDAATAGTANEDDDRGWLAQELAGNGSPPGSYMLGFCALVVISITGFRGPYTLPGWAALGLAAAWGLANARYPAAEEPKD